MKKFFGSLFEVISREINRLFSRRIYFLCMIIIPLICSIFFISLMDTGLPTNLPVAVVDLDNTVTSRNLRLQLDAFEGAKVVMCSHSFREARQEMQKGNIYAIIVIPEDFQKKASSGKQPVLSFYTNNSFFIAGSLLFRDMKTISVLASGAVNLKMGRAKGYPDRQILAQVQPIVVDTNPIHNPLLNYSVYLNNMLLYGILSLMTMAITVYSIGLEIKEKSAREWLQIGNNSMYISIIGKLLPHTIVLFTVGSILSFVLYYGLNFPLNCGIGVMLFAVLLLILTSQALGIVMIATLPTLRLGLSFACLFGMLGFSIAGFSYPVDGMYTFVQALSNLFPLRHYYLIYVEQALNGIPLFYSWGHFVILLGFLLLPALLLGKLQKALLYFDYIP